MTDMFQEQDTPCLHTRALSTPGDICDHNEGSKKTDKQCLHFRNLKSTCPKIYANS